MQIGKDRGLDITVMAILFTLAVLATILEGTKAILP
jgi:hypothetical protein